MLDPYLLTLHGLTLRQLATAEELAVVLGVGREAIERALGQAAAEGAAMTARGAYMITPDGRGLLEAAYPDAFAEIRADPAIAAAMDSFESGVNKQVLAATTDWQTVEVAGERVPNDHSDPDYDGKVIDRLHAIARRVSRVLAPLVAREPRLSLFFGRLEAALGRAEAGELDYVSGVRVDSFHTVWFELHEHILRLTGRERPA